MEESVRVGSDDRLLRVVTEIVSDCLESGRPTRARASRLLAVSTRTLQRRLAEQSPYLRIEKTGRGRFRLVVERPVEMVE